MEVSNISTTPGGNRGSENPIAPSVAEARILGASTFITTENSSQKDATRIESKQHSKGRVEDYKNAKKDLENAKYILKKAEEASTKGESCSSYSERIEWAKDTVKQDKIICL